MSNNSNSNYFQNLVKLRQSDRSYIPDKEIEKEKIERIIEAARLAPSACNAQPWKFIVVTDKELKNKLADACSSKVIGLNHFTKQAPVHIVIIAEKANITSQIGSYIKNKNLPLIDIGIVAEHICLSATSEGLGSCMLGWFSENKVKSLLNIPKNKRPVLIISIGYSSDKLREKKRKTTDSILSYNTY